MSGGVRSAGHHAVGNSQVHHHRSEVRDVGDHLAGPLDGHALVSTQRGVFLCEALGVLGLRGCEYLCAADVDAEFSCASTHTGFVAEDRQVGNLALQQSAGRAQDPVVVTLREDDVLAIASSAVDQLVLEHLWGHDGRDRQCQSVHQDVGVDALFHQTQRGVDLSLRSDCHASAGLGCGACGVESAEGCRQDR